MNRRDLFKLCFGGVAALFIPRPKVKPLETVNLGFQSGYIAKMAGGPAGPGWNEFNPRMIVDHGHSHTLVD